MNRATDKSTGGLNDRQVADRLSDSGDGLCCRGGGVLRAGTNRGELCLSGE
jgi:hypothetical protein